MSICAILAAASGAGASEGTLELACRLARRFDAHLEAFHVRPDPRTVLAATGGLGGPGSAALIGNIMAEAAANATQTRALFDDVVGRHNLPRSDLPPLASRNPSASWREETGDAAKLVARRGRFFDLIVLGRSSRVAHEPHTDAIEEALTRSGRPVLVAPPKPPSQIGDVVAVAWNGSPQAVRALTAALPLLEKANAVSLITAGDADAGGNMLAVEYLAWHGINAEPRTITIDAGRHVGRILLDAARRAGADLLVMGGYGRAPWREQLFGGATHAALAAMPLPLLLMH